MEAWERYELADNAVKKFEATHEAKKKVIIDLAEILKRSGWSGVRFANPNSTHDVAREIQEVVAPDHEAIDPTALDLGGNVKQVVQQYQTLVAERVAAFGALPQGLQDQLRAQRGQRPVRSR
jgi:hypothetical protein